jgi:hypothetical protein
VQRIGIPAHLGQYVVISDGCFSAVVAAFDTSIRVENGVLLEQTSDKKLVFAQRNKQLGGITLIRSL